MKEKKNRQKFEHNPPRPSYRPVGTIMQCNNTLVQIRKSKVVYKY